MGVKYLYHVTFSRVNSLVSGFYGEEQRETWTAETLAKRLTDLHYHIIRAVGAVVTDAAEIEQAEQIERTVKP